MSCQISGAQRRSPWIRILGLNIRHGGGQRVGKLLDYLLASGADVLAISKFRRGATGDALCAGLTAGGYAHCLIPPSNRGENAVLLATRDQSEPLPLAAPQGEQHRLIGANVDGIAVQAVYMSLGEAKLPLFEHFLRQRPSQAVLIGDFNTGLHFKDEAGATFTAADSFAAKSEIGWVDALRHFNGDDAFEPSWLSPRGNGFRLDHAFVAQDIANRVVSCRYDHLTRPALTDHSALIVEIERD